MTTFVLASSLEETRPVAAASPFSFFKKRPRPPSQADDDEARSSVEAFSPIKKCRTDVVDLSDPSSTSVRCSSIDDDTSDSVTVAWDPEVDWIEDPEYFNDCETTFDSDENEPSESADDMVSETADMVSDNHR